MLALFSTAFILIGAPAILLYAGRLIQSATDPAQRAVRQRGVLTGEEWFFRAPQPLVVWPDIRGFFARRRRGVAGV